MKYDAIIFDLDGTLWDTTKSYAYALEQLLIKHPEIKDNTLPENLQYTVGITMDKIAKLVFPTLSADLIIPLMKECLEYACKYLQNNVNSIYPNVQKIIKQIANEYDLYLISDGPYEFFEIFLEQSGLRSYFKDKAILGGWASVNETKKTNLEKLIKNHKILNPLYVGDHQKDLMVAKELGLTYSQAGYGNYEVSEYDYYLENFSGLLDVLKINEICQDASFYQVFSKNKARVVLMENLNNPNYPYLFGFLKFSDVEEDLEEVFLKMEAECQKRNITKIIGPIDYCTWFNYRLPLNEFDLEIYPDIDGNEKILAFLNKRGYNVFEKYKSTLSMIDEKLWEKAKKYQLPANLSEKVVSGKEAYQYVSDIFEVSKEGFQEAFLYSPIKDEVFKKYYLAWFEKINPELVLIFENKTKLVAFALAYQNPDHKFYVSKTVGIKKAYQHHRLMLTLIAKSYELMAKNKIEYVVYHYQSVKKDTLKRLRKGQELLVKYYGLFMKELPNEDCGM